MLRKLLRRLFRRGPPEIDLRPTRDRLLTHPADNRYGEGRAVNEALGEGMRRGAAPPGGRF